MKGSGPRQSRLPTASAVRQLATSDPALMVLGRGLQLLNGLFAGIVIVRLFGLAAAGTYALGMAALTVCSLACGLGLNYSLPRRGLTHEARAFVALVAIASTMVAAVPSLLAFGWAIGSDRLEGLTIAAIGAGGIFLAHQTVFSTLLLMRKRTAACLLPPAFTLAGLGVSVVAAATPLEFALILLIGRAAGSVAMSALLRYELVSVGRIGREARAGLSYVGLDVGTTLADQLPFILLSHLIPREAIGLFGLARQFLGAAESPGWSLVQASYAEMVDAAPARLAVLRRRNTLAGLVFTVLAAAAAVPLAFLFYRQPDFLLPTAIMLCGLPFRYPANFDDQLMRARGATAACRRVTSAKVIVSLVAILAGGFAFGAVGAAAGTVAFSVAIWLFYMLAAYGHRTSVAAVPVNPARAV